ncbi:conserved hypothetical protein [uncultured Alphaproteobacteria bacterium]|uniref:Uncharacterized protein n=1 Tax=uncultured Alphaproteobacteria bacterium TaxID=91750 RepID=A0A212KLX9_9PROT|nr:conserved hypothetical protein [uncultured Alphaproteobacteria bacterium]
MHGGTSPGAPKGNQNARKHGVWSVLLSDEDREFLAADPKERLATLQAMAELRAFRAHKAGKGALTDGVLDTAFARNAAQAANLARTRLAIAEAAAEGVHMDESGPTGEDEAGIVTEDERTAELARLLDVGAKAGAGDAAGPSAVASGEPAADRGAAQSG